MLLDENPSYFYDILGYAYAFGLEDEWFKKFEALNINLDTPDWYVGTSMGSLDLHSLNTAMSDMTSSMNSSAMSSPSSDGGGSSGGGCSGGGSGGGGGGAW